MLLPHSYWMLDQQPRIEAEARRRRRVQAAMLALALLACGVDWEPVLRWIAP